MSRARTLATVLGSDGTLGASDITTALGYTPVNKAGDTIDGNIGVRNGAFFLGRESGTTTGGIQFYNSPADPSAVRMYQDLSAFGGTGGAANTQLQIYSGYSYKLKLDGMNGVSFDAGANYLNDYEEGTFTPAYSGVYGSFSSSGVKEGRYTKIGRVVHVQIRFRGVSASTGRVSFTLTGMPFTQYTYDHYDIGLVDNYPTGVGSGQNGVVINNSSGNNTDWYVEYYNTSSTSSNDVRINLTYTTNA